MDFQAAQTVNAQHSTFIDIRGNLIVNATNLVQNVSMPIDERKFKLDRIRAFLQPFDNHLKFSPPRCLDGTRINLFDKIHQWLDSAEAPNILLLTGHPGAGKSSVASSLDVMLREQGRLGASFFIRHDNENLSDPSLVWRNIAYDLSEFNSTFMDALLHVAVRKEVAPLKPDIDLHFKYLVKNILGDIESCWSTKRPVVLIDALDEIPHSRRRNVFMGTLEKWAELPIEYKLLITSRNENLRKTLQDCCKHIDLPNGPSANLEANYDIQYFLEDGFKTITENDDSLDASWPGLPAIKRLTKYSAGLFIWAKTALDFIESGPPKQMLQAILAGEPTGGEIDVLYTKVLKLSFNRLRDRELKVAKYVLSIILLAKIPIHKQALHHFVGEDADKDSVQFVLKQLSSVISTAKDGTVQFGHLSFADFLCDAARCDTTIFAFNKAAESTILLHTCMRIMKEQLHFNMCDVKSSYLLNEDITAEEIEKYISKSLSYACVFWARHLEDVSSCVTVDESIAEAAAKFLEVQLLYWLEVMSYMKQISSAVAALFRISTVFKADTKTTNLAMDAQKFVLVFQELILKSVPHIYISALPFAPQETGVYRNFIKNYPKTLTFSQGAEGSWPATAIIIEGHTEEVTSVAYSPDGRHVASGSWDKTVRIWDVNTGEMISGPFESHTQPVTSVAYSPDGRHVASGSWDKTVRIWDVHTGEVVSGPFEGHTTLVTSVAYSPDGRNVASGSWDKTVRIWDVSTGEMVSGPFEGHTHGVTSVAYSPDGRHVASGSDDKTVRIWEFNTGEMGSGPFEGHTHGVKSVAYSPDGRHVTSGSDDKTVRIWDVNTGEIVSGPFEGHTDNVRSVAYSPDGRYVASGSDDKTVRIWNVNTGEMASGLFAGHTRMVTAVAYSSDGRHVASGSWDETVRIWDVNTGEMISGPFETHTQPVTSVTYSPDGRHVASGSDDNTVRIWDVNTGEILSGPFEGHTHGVTSVAYSPDGRHVASGSDDGTVRIWDISTGEMVSGPFEGHTEYARSVAYSPDGRHVVSGSWDKTVRIWDVNTGEMVSGPFEGHTHGVTSVAYSPDGRHVVSGSWDKTVRIWDVNTGEMQSGPFEGHTHGVTSVAYSPDGRHAASGSWDKTVRTWDLNTGEMVSGPFEGHTHGVTSVAYSPDGRHVASGSDDGTVRIWDANTGEMVSGAFEGHTDNVRSVAYSPDSRHVASGSDDKTVRIWDVHTGEFVSGNMATSVAYPSGGKYVALGSGDLTVGINHLNAEMDNMCTVLKYGFQVNPSNWCTSKGTSNLFWAPSHLADYLCGPETAMISGRTLKKTELQEICSWSLMDAMCSAMASRPSNITTMRPSINTRTMRRVRPIEIQSGPGRIEER